MNDWTSIFRCDSLEIGGYHSRDNKSMDELCGNAFRSSTVVFFAHVLCQRT